MDISKILEELVSGDNLRAWSAGWAIINANAYELRKIPVNSLPVIRAAIAILPAQESATTIGNYEIPKLALNILELKQSGSCRCSLYSSAQRFLPEEEQARGHVIIENKNDLPWEPEFYCKCIHCGKKYLAQENHGYHYPWAEWRAIT